MSYLLTYARSFSCSLLPLKAMVVPQFTYLIMPSLFSLKLPWLLFVSVHVSLALDWNLDPQVAGNDLFPPVSDIAAANIKPVENSILDSPITNNVGVNDFLAPASDQGGEKILSNDFGPPIDSQRLVFNGFEQASDKTTAMSPQGVFMADGDSCGAQTGRSSRKRRARRGEGTCNWKSPEGAPAPTTEQQMDPQGQITGANNPRKGPPKSAAVVPVMPRDEKQAEQWFPANQRPKADLNICKNKNYPIPVCALDADAIVMFPPVTGLGNICVLIPVTARMFLLPGGCVIALLGNHHYSYM